LCDHGLNSRRLFGLPLFRFALIALVIRTALLLAALVLSFLLTAVAIVIAITVRIVDVRLIAFVGGVLIIVAWARKPIRPRRA